MNQGGAPPQGTSPQMPGMPGQAGSAPGMQVPPTEIPTEDSLNAFPALNPEMTQNPATKSLDALLSKTNLMDELDAKELAKLGMAVYSGWMEDTASRQDWLKDYDNWMKLAMQVVETKNFPWPNASNIKYPILSIACMQFHARAYPMIVPPDGQVVKARVIGKDPDGKKRQKAKCTADFMSWQMMEQMETWDEDMDKGLMVLPIVGSFFKKTYYDDARQVNCSELVHARDLVVNYWAKSLETAERKTQEYYYTKRQLQEKFNAGEYEEPENMPDPIAVTSRATDPISKTQASGLLDETSPYRVLEQHRFWDIDGDDYPEPVIVTILEQTQQVMRIVARWDSDGVITKDDKIIQIIPVEYYTKFPFFPNPDGGFYDVGFGRILGPINESANTLINQLVDAGTLSNLQGGWVSKALRIKQGEQKFKPGEWKQVEATFDDLKKGILPHQYKEPSSVLFQLLGMLIQSSRELSSVSETMTGKMPGQNTPAYTTKETLEQGAKVFTAIHKRMFRSLAREVKKLYRLNQLYTPVEVIKMVTDADYANELFKGDPNDIAPAADPQAVSASTKAMQAQQLVEMVKVGAVPNPPAAFKKVLELLEVDLDPEMMTPPPPQPDPKAQTEQMKQQGEQQKLQTELQMMKEEHQLKMQELQMQMQMLQQELQMKLEFEKAKLELEYQKLGIKQQESQMDMQIAQMDMGSQQVQHSQDMQMKQEQHSQKMVQMKEAAAAKPEAKPK